MATAGTIAYVANTNNLLLTGLKSDLEGTFEDSATVTVTVTDTHGNPVAGGPGWPLTMVYQSGSDGNYLIDLTAFLALVNGKPYIAVIDADASDSNNERIGHWEFPFTAQTRKS